MKPHPSIVPFSAPLSYLALGDDKKPGMSGGLLVRTLRTSADQLLAARLIPLAGDGRPLDILRYEMRPESLRAETEAGAWEFVFSDAATILARADRPDLGMKVDFVNNGPQAEFLFNVPSPDAPGAAPDGRFILANARKSRAYFLLAARSGRFVPDDPHWKYEMAEVMSAVLHPPADGAPAAFALRELPECDWDGVAPAEDFDAVRAARAAEFAAFLDGMPAVPDEFADTRVQAAYVLWASSVGKAGFLKRPALLMSKNWMNRIWSWDHCFNALALAPGHPDLAWDSFCSLFDHQDASGKLPDYASEGEVIWAYVKPPVHGWTLKRLADTGVFSDDRIAWGYDRVARWTRWWLERRDRNRNGLCEYDHGRDSGQDNSTAFMIPPPVETGDLAALLAVQCDALADIARRLGKPESEVAEWTRISDSLIDAMDRLLFDGDGRPLVRVAYTGETYSPDALLTRVPVILGKRLPERLRAPLLAELESDKFLTEWGYATESPASPHYQSDGYWLGSIWAPTTLFIFEGLRGCGREDLAREVAMRFCRLCKKSGFAECFDAITGEGQRDRAYTWTASIFFLLAEAAQGAADNR
jgi:hypothetical protein